MMETSMTMATTKNHIFLGISVNHGKSTVSIGNVLKRFIFEIFQDAALRLRIS